MPRVVPSQVIAVIDRLFPKAKTQGEGQLLPLSPQDSPQVMAVAGLIEQIPTELIVLSPEDYSTLTVCLEALRTHVARWQATGDFRALGHIPGLERLNPITLIRRCLAKCPDQFPTPDTAELAFIGDQALRESIRLDISGATRDLAQGEWKGATVLAGSAIEALLLWALEEHEKRKSGSRAPAIATLRADRTLTRQPDANPEKWDLHEYIEVAAHLGLIKPDTATSVRLAKEFRNLIHPGRAVRLGQKCDRATALQALAAAEAVVRDLGSQ